MAKMPQTVSTSGAKGTTILKAQAPDRGSLNKNDTSSMNGKMGGSRTNLDHSIKC